MARVTDKPSGVFRSLDWWTILIYMALLIFGWLSVCGASYTYGDTDIFSLSTRSGMQIVWIATSVFLGMVLVLLDDRFYDMFSYIIYVAFLVLLFATIFNPHDIKGSRSWLVLGPIRLQPAEFAKFATALAVSKFMGRYGFDIHQWKDFAIAIGIVLLPMLFIIAQKETGSALVYLSFFLMFYREGMPGSVLFTGVAMVIYFVLGIKYEDTALWSLPVSAGKFMVLLLVQVFSASMVYLYCKDKRQARFILLVCLGVTALSLLFAQFVLPFDVVWVQLIVSIVLIGYLVYCWLASQMRSYLYIALFAVGSIVFFYSADYVLNNVMKPHQRVRITVLLGLEEDVAGAGYNVHQSEIAIGAGGLRGKGFLNGTQTKLKFGRGRRIHWFCRRVGAFLGVNLATHQAGRTPTVCFWAHLWLLCGQHFSVPCLHQRGHGVRTYACHRHSIAVFQLWWFVALGLHPPAVHLPPDRCGAQLGTHLSYQFLKSTKPFTVSSGSLPRC